MGLFDHILAAITNPEQQASQGQVASVLGTLQRQGQAHGTDSQALAQLLSVVGQQVRGALQQQRADAGPQQAQTTVQRYSGTEANPQAVQALFGARQPQVVQEAANRTGIDASTIQALLPIVIPLILQLLQGGTNSRNPQQGNPLLGTFLDTDNDGDVDLGDMVRMAGRLL
ncbi:DUF937 domain-containing protein [Gloeobacter morelensis]|uniref:DUF937 domain-containing protein n=1 Tax=Gloeobacter morelensis MG652769 TaxID=2781736 RepID=A0ABY3PLP4_9CYAN|nr:DUF937 domain-containing protein [Gloeobacter morelensis]UFP94519.1 DUF937 domain-containing protein [Gloeobacter morelensis MG652769]